MYNFKKSIFFIPSVLSCGSAFSGVSGLVKRMTENDVLKMLKNFVTEKITLPGNSKIKILNLAPWVVSREGEVLNIFNTSSFGDFIDREGENSFYAYYVMGEGSEHFLISPYIGVTISCSKVNELLIPNTVYFSLQDKSFARMDIEHSEEQTKFTFKNSCVIVNNATAKVDPFALDKCKIDLGEIRNLVNSLKETTALPFLKYFYDCAAAKEGTKVIYFDENYFNSKFNSLGDYYINLNGEVEEIKEKLQEWQRCTLKAKDNNHELYFMKIFIDFPFPPLEAIKHVILLASYQGKWFIIDSNGGDTDYYKGCNFSKVLSELKITLCKNGVYEQIGNGCDTCSSINSYVLSAYLAKNGKLPLLPNGDIDFSKIYHFAKEENIFPLPLFFVETQEF